jgi:hypothetical protein
MGQLKKWRLTMADVFTTTGRAFVVDELDAFGTYYCGWGTGAGTAATSDTTLFTEASETRDATTDSQPSANVFQWVGLLEADGAKTITNAGIFDAISAGNMIVKSDFTGVVLALGDKIEFTFQLTVT